MTLASLAFQLPLPLRIAAFRAAESASKLRQGRSAAKAGTAGRAEAKAQPSLWIFVSTIGELNAVEPFVKRLLAELGHPPLTLLTDRTTYDAAYQARYPDARIEVVDGTWSQASDLARRQPPLFLLVAEIPCLLHDAPCRFSFALMHSARRAGAAVVMVNGWLYGYTPPSRLDAIEVQLFGRDYLRAFDLMLVQTEDIRTRLISRGADASSVVVTGNIKFDAMLSAPTVHASSPFSEALSRRGPGPVIVAGSVTETADQQALLAAFGEVKKAHAQALLVLAPRHPENRERMEKLVALLDATALDWRRRSAYPEPNRVPESVAGDVLVLDTMGELRGCYGAASLAFVGTDHNVLEPLSFGCPVFVSGTWEPTFPSYPVYVQLRDAGAITAVQEVADLGPAWVHALQTQTEPGASRGETTSALLAPMRGAVERCRMAMRQHSSLRSLFATDADL